MSARLLRWLLFAIAAAPSLLPAQPEPRFDVASVKPNLKAACFGRWDFAVSHGTLNAVNAPLLRIISRAFNLTDDRVTGPSWLDSQCFDIHAKAAGNLPDRDLMPMLQTLLRERFHLRVHHETAERPILALVIDKGGTKLRPYGEANAAPPPSTEGAILFMARHLPDLCERLGKVTGRPVIDRTGLGGDYMIVLRYLPLGASNGDAADPEADIVAAVRDQLGLRLESQRGAVDVLKIDSIDRVPSKN